MRPDAFTSFCFLEPLYRSLTASLALDSVAFVSNEVSGAACLAFKRTEEEKPFTLAAMFEPSTSPPPL